MKGETLVEMERKPIGPGETLLGGHEGVDVVRTERGIEKRAYAESSLAGIRNEADKLRALAGTGVAPELLEEGEDHILEEDLGESEPIVDGEAFRRNATRVLWTLRQHRIAHGDAGIHKNMAFKNDRIVLLDFEDSWYYDEPVPDPKKVRDSSMLWRVVASTPAQKHPQPDTPRIVRRWQVIEKALGGAGNTNTELEGKTLLDLGCFQGDHCAMAAADGMVARGVDTGRQRPESNSIDVANDLWRPMVEAAKVEFLKANIMDWRDFKYDVVLLLSTFAYIVKYSGEEAASRLVKRILSQGDVLFFETQLAGDGPGPAFLKSHADVERYLGRFGKARKLATYSVWNRPARRSLWKVTSG